jgi:hypothetical protein
MSSQVATDLANIQSRYDQENPGQAAAWAVGRFAYGVGETIFGAAASTAYAVTHPRETGQALLDTADTAGNYLIDVYNGDSNIIADTAAFAQGQIDVAGNYIGGIRNTYRTGGVMAVLNRYSRDAGGFAPALAVPALRGLRYVGPADDLVTVGRGREADIDAADPGTSTTRSYSGGAYGRLPSIAGLERHHTPADSVTPWTRYSGPAIQMEIADHLRTSSHGRQGLAGAEYRAQVGELMQHGRVRDAMAMEIRDVRRAVVTGGRPISTYNPAIQDMLWYMRDRGFLPGK